MKLNLGKLLELNRAYVEKKIKDEKENTKRYSKHLSNTFGDQKGQVEFLINNVFDYENRGLYKKGYFVDLAAADGITGSNTLFLEKNLNWTGILIEANPKFISELRNNRKVKIIEKCCSGEMGERIKFRTDNGQMSGIVSEYTDNNTKNRGAELKKADIIELETTTLLHELEINEAPKTIDFMSLDIEGAEFEALKNFDFGKYKFKCITIERPSLQLDLLLDENGYRQVKHLYYDVIYVHEDYIKEINWSPRIKFAITPKK